MGFGDEILAAGQAQVFYDRFGETVTIVDKERRPRWHPIWDGNPAIARPEAPNWNHVVINGPSCRPYIVYPFTEDTGWTFNTAFRAREHRAKIYLTDEELALGRKVAAMGPFVLVDPWSKHENLRWPFQYWQELVNRLLPSLRVVQHTWGDAPLLDHVEAIHTPSFRAACSVLTGATLYVRGESGMCHAAAALDRPNVAIWGGCMDWDVLGGYPKQIGIGISEACGSWRPCAHCKLAMASIAVDVVERAVWNQLTCYGLG